MRQFLHASDSEFQTLEAKARFSCVAYRRVELPPDCQPDHARIGFEIDPTSGQAKLLVERGVRYHGTSRAVKTWLDDGVLCFANFQELQQWIRGELAACYQQMETDSRDIQADDPSDLAPDRLTDLTAVNRAADRPRGLYLDEQKLTKELCTQVRGQDLAIGMLAHRVVQHVARIRPARPLTVFAVGPTGCGKTKTAASLVNALRCVAEEESGYHYLRLDMSEYQERHRMSQLLGSPQGYVGYGDGSQLVDALRAHPRTVVLFDEIEKAHPDVFLTLINAMDAGRLSTSARAPGGRTIDCRRAIFMFTSNLDADEIIDDLAQLNAWGDSQRISQICRCRLRVAGLRPELIARIGLFLAFQPLSRTARAEIVVQAIARVALEYGLRIEHIAPSVIEAILSLNQEGFGARPDEYAIDDLLGSAFIQAAAVRTSALAYQIAGPPFACTTLDPTKPS